MTRMLINNKEMAMGDGWGIKKGCWKHQGCQVGQKQIGQQGVLRMLKMLNIMSKEAKKYMGNIGVENIFQPGRMPRWKMFAWANYMLVNHKCKFPYNDMKCTLMEF